MNLHLLLFQFFVFLVQELNNKTTPSLQNVNYSKVLPLKEKNTIKNRSYLYLCVLLYYINLSFLRIVKRLKLVLSVDIEENPGHFHDLQELLSYEQFLGTEGQSNTVKFCLLNFRSVS